MMLLPWCESHSTCRLSTSERATTTWWRMLVGILRLNVQATTCRIQTWFKPPPVTCHGKERSPLPSCDFQVTLPISCFKKRPNRKKQLSCQQNGPPLPSCDFQVTLPISCLKTKGRIEKKSYRVNRSLLPSCDKQVTLPISCLKKKGLI